MVGSRVKSGSEFQTVGLAAVSVETVCIIYLFQCQLVLTNDLELNRFYDSYALMLLYSQAYYGFLSRK